MIRALFACLALSACTTGLSPLADMEPEASSDLAGQGAQTVDVDLTGRTWMLDLVGMDIVQPARLDLLLGEVDHDFMLFYVEADQGDTLSMLVSPSDEIGRQDPCAPIRPIPGVDFSANPIIEASGFRMDMVFDGQPVSLHDAYLSAVIDPAGDAWSEGVLSGTLDLRDLAAAALPPDTDTCGYIEMMGGTCDPCSDGTRTCTSVELGQMSAWQAAWAFDTRPSQVTCGG